MLAPVWIASPPEVHSALLSSGPGPGALLSAAGAWNSLSAQYASTATELTALLDTVQAGPWQGASAERYAAAHLPYLDWLTRASADSAGAAAQHEVAAAAYSTALATMPTLGELAANHVTHTVLVATNFFGINTIPIALNEADYARMWVQAATTMSGYHAVAGLALASAPRTEPAPPVLKSNNLAAAGQPGLPGSDFFSQMFSQLMQFIQHPAQVIKEILNNPAALVSWFPLLFFVAYEAFWIPAGFTMWGLIIAAPIALPIAIGLGASYLLGLSGQFPTFAFPAAVPAAGPALAQPMPVTAGFGAGIATPGAPAAPAAAPAAAAPAAPAPAVTVFGYLVSGTDPGTGYGPTLIDRNKAQAPAARVPAAAAAVRASVRRQARARRHRRAMVRDYADEFMDMDTGVDAPTAVASARGTGPLGATGTRGGAFAGTLDKTVAEAAGLATLSGDGFGGGPSAPMLPETWRDDGAKPEPALEQLVTEKGVSR